MKWKFWKRETPVVETVDSIIAGEPIKPEPKAFTKITIVCLDRKLVYRSLQKNDQFLEFKKWFFGKLHKKYFVWKHSTGEMLINRDEIKYYGIVEGEL